MDSEAREFRSNLRPWIVAFAINVVFAVVLLGIPYTRGPNRAEETMPRFVGFMTCFFDAEAVPVPGLGLPRGDRARYATLVLQAAPDWPGRCLDELEAIAPDESVFLFPGVKSAEAQLRAAVALVGEELRTLSRARAEDGARTVSDRPMRALAALRASLAELGIASGVEALSGRRDAIVLGPAVGLPTPSIVPTRVSADGEWRVSLHDGALVANASDSRAVAHVRVLGGAVEQLVTRRPALARGLVGHERAWVIWSTADERCADGEGCHQQTTGLAAFLEDRQTLEPMVWLRAHPRGSPTASVWISGAPDSSAGASAWVVARAEEGLEARRFELPEPRVRALGEARGAPQQPPVETVALPSMTGELEVAWLPGEPPALALLGDGAAALLRLDADAEPRRWEPPRGTALLASCGDADAGWVAVGSERGMAVRSMASPEVLRPALPVRPPDRGALLASCGPDGGVEIWARTDGGLWSVRCDVDACEEPRTLPAPHVDAFDVTRFGDETLVAWTDDAEAGAVRVVRWRQGAEPEVTIPAACWVDPGDGLCGRPRWASDGSTVMLVTRDGDDLRVLTSDDGRTWASLPGLGQP